MTESRKNFQNMLNMLPSGFSGKDELIEKTGVFWDFQEFVMAKFSITEQETESKFRTYILDKLKDASDEDKANPQIYIDYMCQYATELEFTQVDKLKEGFSFLSQMGANIDLQK